MENKTVIRTSLIKVYNEHSFTHHYIAVFIYKGTVYATIIDSVQMFGTCAKLDKASRGAGYSLRFKPNNSEKLDLLSNAERTIVLCSAEMFKQLVAESEYNKGEVIEKLVTEYFGQTWVKDNVPFTEDGDLTVNGIAYQIKFEKATFINEQQAMRLNRG